MISNNNRCSQKFLPESRGLENEMTDRHVIIYLVNEWLVPFAKDVIWRDRKEYDVKQANKVGGTYLAQSKVGTYLTTYSY